MAGTVIIEGAVASELDVLIERFKPEKMDMLGGFKLYGGMAGGEDIMLLNTEVGVANAAAATALACALLRPYAIISQGTAGAHDIALHTGDMVIGQDIVRLGAYRSPESADEVDPFKWEPINFGGDKCNMLMQHSDAALVELAKCTAAELGLGGAGDAKLICGTVGSGDVWNREAAMIAHLNARYGTACEEMETFAAAQICARFGVPMLSLRVISNNERLGEKYAPQTAAALQRFSGEVALKILAAK